MVDSNSSKDEFRPREARSNGGLLWNPEELQNATNAIDATNATNAINVINATETKKRIEKFTEKLKIRVPFFFSNKFFSNKQSSVRSSSRAKSNSENEEKESCEELSPLISAEKFGIPKEVSASVNEVNLAERGRNSPLGHLNFAPDRILIPLRDDEETKPVEEIPQSSQEPSSQLNSSNGEFAHRKAELAPTPNQEEASQRESSQRELSQKELSQKESDDDKDFIIADK
jgi:hypothetical protein